MSAKWKSKTRDELFSMLMDKKVNKRTKYNIASYLGVSLYAVLHGSDEPSGGYEYSTGEWV